MRAITVRQPWARAIVHGGKDVENRSRNIAGSYRGPVAIHAAKLIDEGGQHSPLVRDAWVGPTRMAIDPDPRKIGFYYDVPDRRAFAYGAIIGVVDLVDVHSPATDLRHDEHCEYQDGSICSVWARLDQHHLVLANPRPLPKPIPYRGRLGLWTVPADVAGELAVVIGGSC